MRSRQKQFFCNVFWDYVVRHEQIPDTTSFVIHSVGLSTSKKHPILSSAQMIKSDDAEARTSSLWS